VATDRAERLLNLVFVLLSARRPVTRQRLRDTIPGYDESASDEAFERMFERDKEELRSLGVPIETLTEDGATADEAGYRIPRESFELPDIKLDPEAMAVVRVAAMTWTDETLAPAATRALQKLEAAGLRAHADETTLVSRLSADEPAFATLLEAATSRRAVTFAYRRPDQSEPMDRRVEPWGVAEVSGRWYVVGHDRDRGATRVFRLSRITSSVRTLGPENAYEVPTGVLLPDLVRRNQPSGPTRTAVLAVLPDRCRGLRSRATNITAGADRDLIEIGFDDEEALAGEVVSFAEAIRVESPADVKAAVLRRLRAAAVPS
jgi:predicted DNA-binding transcriptional regulator YafY